MTCESTTCDLFETRQDRQNLESLLGQRILGTHTTVCASVTALLEKDMRAIPEGHFVHSILGQGSYGTVLGLCEASSGTDAKLALKIMSDSTDARSEVDMQREFYAIGLAPRIISVSEKRGNIFVLMTRVDMTLSEYLMKNARYTSDGEIDLIFGEIEDLIRSLFHQRLAHGDMHLDNLVVNVNAEGGTFDGLGLIDFGLAKRIEGDSVVTLEMLLFMEYLSILRTVDSLLGPLEDVVLGAVMRRLDAPDLAEVRGVFQTGPNLEKNHKTQDDTLHVVLALFKS